MLITKYLWRCAPDVFAKLEGSTIITILQVVFGHPVAVAILPLGRYPCNYRIATEIHLNPLVDIICESRPAAKFASICLQVQPGL